MKPILALFKLPGRVWVSVLFLTLEKISCAQYSQKIKELFTVYFKDFLKTFSLFNCVVNFDPNEFSWGLSRKNIFAATATLQNSSDSCYFASFHLSMVETLLSVPLHKSIKGTLPSLRLRRPSWLRGFPGPLKRVPQLLVAEPWRRENCRKVNWATTKKCNATCAEKYLSAAGQ